MIYSFTFGAIFLISGILFFTGKALPWIKGWENMSAQEKEKIRIMPLCRNIGTMLVLAAAGFIAAGCSDVFREGMFRFAMIGWLVICGLDLWYIEKSGKYVIKDNAN